MLLFQKCGSVSPSTIIAKLLLLCSIIFSSSCVLAFSLFRLEAPPWCSSSTRLFAKFVVEPKQVVEFEQSKKAAVLGAILEPDGKKNWKVLTSSGRTFSIPPREIKHIVIGAVATTEADIAIHEDAATRALKNDKSSNGADVVAIWEMLTDDGESETDLVTLAELLLGDSSPEACYSTRKVLTEGVEKIRFKEIKGGNKFSPRASDVVETLKAKIEAEAQEKAKWDTLKQRIDSACNGEGEFLIQNESDDVQNALKALERLGCLTSEISEIEKAKIKEEEATSMDLAETFLKRIGRKATSESARSLLIGTGLWSIHENLDIIRLRVATDFSEDLEEESTNLINEPPPDIDVNNRIDLTHLCSLAIDEASTSEIDDAVSVEVLPNTEKEPLHKRQRLWIHIADPTRYVDLDTPLDKEARRRTSSLYLPTGTITMFPEALATGPLSLEPEKISCALSVGVMLDAHGGIDVDSPTIVSPSLVRTTRLTYQHANKLLDPFYLGNVSDEDKHTSSEGGNDEQYYDEQVIVDSLRRLQWVSEKRLEWRKAGGSLESISEREIPDMVVKVSQDDSSKAWDISIIGRDRDTANSLVMELMLLANEAIASYCNDHSVPVPYRSQAMYGISQDEIDATPEGPCRSWLGIRSMMSSQISSSPRPHEGLGLDAYVQATSPIRRYTDFAIHHQIKAHLRGDELPFSEESILSLVENGGKPQQLERSANDYWLREFLRRREGQPIGVLVLSVFGKQNDMNKLLLPELGAIVTCRCNRPLVVGSELELQPTSNGDFIY